MQYLPKRAPLIGAWLIAAAAFMASPIAAQTIFIEEETAGGFNDTFAQAEDCRALGNDLIIRGTVHAGNANSDDEWFMFNGAAGACVNIDMNITVQMGTGSPYQLNVWLYDSSQTMVAAWNMTTIASSMNFGIGPYTLPATDTYYVYITEWSVAPNALVQPGITFTPLSNRGFGVTGATPDSTRDTGGGNQTVGSQYELTVGVTSGNEKTFDIFMDCDPSTNTVVCSPNPANICWMGSSAPNARFRASSKCLPAGVNVSIMGGGAGLVMPGTTMAISAPGPAVSATFTVDDGTGVQPGGTVQTVRSVLTSSGEVVNRMDVCPLVGICLDVCAPAGSSYVAVLAEGLGPAIPLPPFLPALQLDTTSILFGLTFPANQIAPLMTGAAGVSGTNQICFAAPPGLVTGVAPIYLQVVTFTGAGLTGLTPPVTLNLIP